MLKYIMFFIFKTKGKCSWLTEMQSVEKVKVFTPSVMQKVLDTNCLLYLFNNVPASWWLVVLYKHDILLVSKRLELALPYY